MNINRIKCNWPMTTSSSLAMIDRMNVSDALECGLITEAEKEAIVDAFISEVTIALETKGRATSEDIDKTPKSEIVKRFRKGLGQTKPGPGCE